MIVSIEANRILSLYTYPGDRYLGQVEFTISRSNVNLTLYKVSYRPSPPIRPER